MRARNPEKALNHRAEPIRQTLKEKNNTLKKALIEYLSGLRTLSTGLAPEQQETILNIAVLLAHTDLLLDKLDEST